MSSLNSDPPGVDPSASSSRVLVEEAVDVLSCSLPHHGLQLRGGGVAELPEAGKVLQQSQSFDPAHPRNLLHQSQDLRLQQPRHRPPSEGVLSVLPQDLESIRAGQKIRTRNQEGQLSLTHRDQV